MRAFNHLLLAATLAISIVSCQKEPSFHHDAIPSPSDLVASLAPETYGIDGDNTFVPAMAVEGYAMSKKPAITKAGGSISVEPVLNEANDTVFYIVNYGDNDGWELISADARTPRILAEGYSGSFTYPTEIEPLNVWIEGMIADLTAVREAEDSELTFSSEQISANISAWTGVAAPHVIQPGELDGQYLGSSTYEEQPYDSIPHLMVTQWHQNAPYNSYVPWTTSAHIERAPAGCVAIAGAQVLYYCHYKYGAPTMMETVASCSSNIFDSNPNASMTQSSPSTNAWSQMVTTYRTGAVVNCIEAVMIAKVGKNVSTVYQSSRSSATMTDLKSRVFSPHGISCDSGNFNASDVRSSLLSRSPVILDLQHPNGFAHVLVIDGYKRMREKITTRYYWVPDDPHSSENPEDHPDFTIVSYSDPTLTLVKMNWGLNQWNDSPTLDGWFALTSGWPLYSPEYGNFTPDKKKILYNFRRSN